MVHSDITRHSAISVRHYAHLQQNMIYTEGSYKHYEQFNA